jgi:vacuolar protein sorting-associated protein 13A/C
MIIGATFNFRHFQLGSPNTDGQQHTRVMFESLVSGLLQKYLGKYVKNFNTKDLDIALFSGKVVLKNLELRADALDELDLPLRVRSGFLGDLTLDIPFSSLGSQPVVVSIDRIFLVVGTKTDFRPESRTEEDIRAETLLKLEALKQHESDMFSAAKVHFDACLSDESFP